MPRKKTGQKNLLANFKVKLPLLPRGDRKIKLPKFLGHWPILKDLTIGSLALMVFLIFGIVLLAVFGNQIVKAYHERTAAAIVNGEVVPKDVLTRRVLQSYGEDTVQQIVNETLVLQEGRQAKISITQAEIDAEIKRVEDQIAPEKLSDALAQRHLTMDDLKRQIIVNLTAQKILGKDVTVSDQEIEEYFNQNKDTLAQAKGKKPEELTLAEVKDDIRSNLLSQKTNEKLNAWIEELRAKSQIQTFANP